MTLISHNNASQTGVIPRLENRNAKINGTQAIRLEKLRITAPLFVCPKRSMSAGAFTHINDRHKLTTVARIDTLCALAPATIMEGAW